LQLVDAGRLDQRQVLDAVGQAALVEGLEAGQLVLGRRHDDLAAALDADAARPAELDHHPGPLHAEPGLGGAGAVVDPGMDDAAVVARLVRGEPRLLLEDDEPRAGGAAPQQAGGRQRHDPAADDRHVVPVGHGAVVYPLATAARRSAMAGKYFEELEVGQTFHHQPGRTVTEADNVFFSCLTMNPQSLHVDFHAAAKAEFGRPLVNSLLTLGITVGLSVGDATLRTTVGNLGFEKIEFPRPVFHGDTIYAETEVVDKRESRSRPQWGIVTFEHRARNQEGEIVVRARRNAMM